MRQNRLTMAVGWRVSVQTMTNAIQRLVYAQTDALPVSGVTVKHANIVSDSENEKK